MRPGQSVLDVLVENNLVASQSDGWCMLAQNCVRLDGEMLIDASQAFPHPGVLQVGNRRYLRLVA